MTTAVKQQEEQGNLNQLDIASEISAIRCEGSVYSKTIKVFLIVT